MRQFYSIVFAVVLLLSPRFLFAYDPSVPQVIQGLTSTGFGMVLSDPNRDFIYVNDLGDSRIIVINSNTFGWFDISIGDIARDLAISYDGNTLAAAQDNGDITFIDLNTVAPNSTPAMLIHSSNQELSSIAFGFTWHSLLFDLYLLGKNYSL